MSALSAPDAEAVDAAEIADSATAHAFFNCYLRETGEGSVRPATETPVATDADRVLALSLDRQEIEVFAPLAHESLTGRHLFESFHYRPGQEVLPLDSHTLAALCVKELTLSRDGDPGELLHRVTLSRRAIGRYVEGRAGDDVTDPEATFREAEQSLVFGHLLHPTPKSRQGMGDDAERYAPELAGSFQLHYARADPGVVESNSALGRSATEWIREDLRAAGEAELAATDDVLIPLHPRQADIVRERPAVRSLVDDGHLAFLGPAGRTFYPTTSVRTVYAPDAPFMVKCTLDVKITNSRRTNKRDELDRGVAIAELLDSDLGDDLGERFPGFDIVRDPAYLTVRTPGDGESGFETVLRNNAVPGDPERTTPVVALCQDAISGPEHSRLGRLVRSIADREDRSTDAVAREWYREYLRRSVRPALWLYLEGGLGVEAHQQNSVLTLDADGYPETFRYRDNQGYYLPESQRERVESSLPDAAERLGTLCPDAVADERLRYYLVLNNAFGVINAAGCAGLVDERDLLAVLREELEYCRRFDRESSSFLDDLLTEPSVPCKANLLTRFRDMDELVGSLDDQSVYADVDNPHVAELWPDQHSS
jgi:siderophore synthetase component